MFRFMIIGVVVLVSLHIASYGWYALKEEKNRRGAVGAFLVAGATLLAPVLLILYYTFIVG